MEVWKKKEMRSLSTVENVPHVSGHENDREEGYLWEVHIEAN